jgi:flagellar hook-basal body complex protein FliE
MATPINAATAAYTNAARLINQAAKGVEMPTDAAGGGDFARVLADTVQGMVESGRVADRKAMDMVNGQGDIVDVVTAISQTEMAIETMVSVRDRVISAYEEIMRMPI